MLFERSVPPPSPTTDVFTAAMAYLENDCPYVSDWLKEINKDLGKLEKLDSAVKR